MSPPGGADAPHPAPPPVPCIRAYRVRCLTAGGSAVTGLSLGRTAPEDRQIHAVPANSPREAGDDQRLNRVRQWMLVAMIRCGWCEDQAHSHGPRSTYDRERQAGAPRTGLAALGVKPSGLSGVPFRAPGSTAQSDEVQQRTSPPTADCGSGRYRASRSTVEGRSASSREATSSSTAAPEPSCGPNPRRAESYVDRRGAPEQQRQRLYTQPREGRNSRRSLRPCPGTGRRVSCGWAARSVGV